MTADHIAGEIGPWPMFEERDATPDVRGILTDARAEKDLNARATCDDGSDQYLTPEWVFYAAVLAHERDH